MKTQIENVVISDKIHTNEKRLGRFSCLRISGNVYELTARCEHPDGGHCFRSFGLYEGVDSLPDFYYQDKFR